MDYKQLIDYVEEQRKNNKSDYEIEANLTKANWRIEDIDIALGRNKPIAVPIPPIDYRSSSETIELHNDTPQKHFYWDMFEHVLLYICLAIFSTSFAMILHEMVDLYMPLYSSYSYASKSSMTGYAASLIVTLPLFATLLIHTRKRILSNPKIREIRLCKILIYFTLLATFITAVVGMIGLITNIFNGEVTVNSALHFLIIVSISTLIFVYHFFQIRGDTKI